MKVLISLCLTIFFQSCAFGDMYYVFIDKDGSGDVIECLPITVTPTAREQAGFIIYKCDLTQKEVDQLLEPEYYTDGTKYPDGTLETKMAQFRKYKINTVALPKKETLTKDELFDEVVTKPTAVP